MKADPQKVNAPGEGAFTKITAKTVKDNAAIIAEHAPTDKEFSTVGALFALAGHELKRRAYPGGRKLFEVGRWGQYRQFSAWHDVVGFLAQIGG